MIFLQTISEIVRTCKNIKKYLIICDDVDCVSQVVLLHDSDGLFFFRAQQGEGKKWWVDIDLYVTIETDW